MWRYTQNGEPNADQAAELAAAFDEMARKEGFDESLAHFTDSATFEDEFGDDAFVFDDPEEDGRG